MEFILWWRVCASNLLLIFFCISLSEWSHREKDSCKGHIERKTVAKVYQHSNYSTFEFIKGENEHTLWESKQQTRG